MISSKVKEVVQLGTIAAVRKAVPSAPSSQADLDTLFKYAFQNGKASVIKHIAEFGAPSSVVAARGVLAMVQNAKAKPALEWLGAVDDADVDVADGSGRTLLANAVRLGNQKLVDALLAKGADVNRADKKGRHVLYWAFVERKAKAAKMLLEQDVVLSSEQATVLLKHAPSEPLRAKVIEILLSQRVSSMTREEFVQKWGAIRELPSPVARCEDPLGNEIMKGRFTTAGYFSRSSGKDPFTDDLDWEAIDHAKTIAESLIEALGDTSYVPNSTGGSSYTAFFIPSLGRMPKTDDFDARISSAAMDAANGTYAKFITSESTGTEFFVSEHFYEDSDFIDAETRALFMAANAIADKHLDPCKKYTLYPDFITMPVIFGGLDAMFNFVGVIAEDVWA